MRDAEQPINLKSNPMKTPFLTQPDTGCDITRPQVIGRINCINVARLGQPQALRYYGTSAVCGASGNAHTTQRQAEQDVQDWAAGKPVGYVQHAVVPLDSKVARYAPMVAAGVAADRCRTRRPYLLLGVALASVLLYFNRN
jgi:hypothetical protein